MKKHLHIGILGGGPSALLLLKKILDSKRNDLTITVFEKTTRLGEGMPYSKQGACDEHITNVSANELPELFSGVTPWLESLDKDTLSRFGIDPDHFSVYKVLPRRLFGRYLADQFAQALEKAKLRGLDVKVHLKARVADIVDLEAEAQVEVCQEDGQTFRFDHVVICTGHCFPNQHEGEIAGYFDSPYPPEKLSLRTPHPVALRGASLTAIDAMRTLSRHNGKFEKDADGKPIFVPDAESAGFKLVMHSRNGLLPAVRFHLEDSRLGKDHVLTTEEIAANKSANGGFLSLDYVFEKNFKGPLRKKDPDFAMFIEDMNLETFVAAMTKIREDKDPFALMEEEYREAEESIALRESVYWKEMLAGLSFALNYPAKYFSAEDMQRLQEVLMPLITVVIASVPQHSVEEMLALHRAGFLELREVTQNSKVIPCADGGVDYEIDAQSEPVHYETYVDCVGQGHVPFAQFPFKSLRENRTVTQARVQFKDPENGKKQLLAGNKDVTADQSGRYFLNVSGVAIDDSFAIVDFYGARNDRIFLMAVPYMGGYNPDYSGLDFCEAAGTAIATALTGVAV